VSNLRREGKKMLNKYQNSSEKIASLLTEFQPSEAFELERAKVEIAEQIHRIMEQQNISNVELARRLGSSKAYVTKILQGNSNFTIESLIKISRAISCQIDIQFSQPAPAKISTRQVSSRNNLRNIHQQKLNAA
jgi:plasmid maintenance system antidote protein VapI